MGGGGTKPDPERCSCELHDELKPRTLQSAEPGREPGVHTHSPGGCPLELIGGSGTVGLASPELSAVTIDRFARQPRSARFGSACMLGEAGASGLLNGTSEPVRVTNAGLSGSESEGEPAAARRAAELPVRQSDGIDKHGLLCSFSSEAVRVLSSAGSGSLGLEKVIASSTEQGGGHDGDGDRSRIAIVR